MNPIKEEEPEVEKPDLMTMFNPFAGKSFKMLISKNKDADKWNHMAKNGANFV